MSYTYKGNQPIPEKRKKRMSGGKIALIVILCTIFVLPLATVGVLYALIYDGKTIEVEYDKDANIDTVFNSMLVDSLDNTKTTKAMDLKMTQRHLNTILKSSLQEITKDGKYVKNFYVLADDGNFDFDFEVNLKIIKTRLQIKTVLTIVEEADGSETLQFDIVDLRAGHLGGLLRFKNLAMKYIPTDDINHMFDDTGLSLKLDLDKLRLTYNSKDFYNDITNFINNGGDSSDFVQIFSEILDNKSLRTLHYEDDTIFGISVPINNLKLSSATHGIDGLTIADGTFVSDEINDNTARSIKRLLDQGKLKTTDNLQNVGYYLIGGYDSLSSARKNYIDSLGSSVFGENYRDYEAPYDYTIAEEDTIKYIVDEQTRKQIASHPERITAVIKTSDINRMLRTSETMGGTNYFVRNVGTETEPNYKVNYVALDNLTTIINGRSIYIAMNVNFNGAYGQMTLKCTQIDHLSTDDFGQFAINIDAMYMGDLQVSSKTQEAFVSTITDSLDTALFKVRDGKIIFDIAGTMENAGVIQYFYNMDFAFTSNTATTDGTIQIVATRK